jgi:hypothetical protein
MMAIGASLHRETDGLLGPEMLGSGGAPVQRWYVGERCPAGCRVVVVEGAEVHPLRARTHDPLWSFSWGRSGSSARELAWSVLHDSARDLRLADDWCAAFTIEVISLLPRDAFRMASRDVIVWLSDERLAGATDRLLRHVRHQTLAADGVDGAPESADVDLDDCRRPVVSVPGRRPRLAACQAPR